jgi:RNA polymerase sigma-70 factor (ECF subfamily)
MPHSLWLDLDRQVRAFVARRIPPADAADVAQDVLLRLSASSERLAQADNAGAWALGVARHTVADFYRARGRMPLTQPKVEEASDGALPGEHLADYAGTHSVHEEVLTWLRPMAESLPAHYADALIRADFEGQPQHEIADALGLSLSGAKSRVQRARVLLGEAVRACCDVSFGPEGRAQSFERRRQPDCCA